MIDTHAHVYTKEFKDDLDNIVENFQKEGGREIYMPNIDHDSIDIMLDVEDRYPDICYSMMGLHPGSVGENFETQLYEIENWLSKRKFIAVGEIGIDLYWDRSLKKFQEEAFRIQIAFAKKYQLPIVIHSRDAFEETISIVEELYDQSLTGVFHRFSGTKEEAVRITSLGFSLGVGGVVTFKNGGLDKVIPDLSLEDIILETDSPYLSPAPYRGKRNEPSYLRVIAQKVADLRQISIDVVSDVTTKNARKLFNHL